jgi:pSer/pThr/pTyr-binding forkhead associated (FHA) protein
VVGRELGAAIALGHRSVSRRHAVIRESDGDLVLEDSGSTFGTYVNDRQLEAGKPLVLRDGDLIRFGHVQVVCRLETGALDPEAATREALFASQANARVILLESGTVRRKPVAGAVTLIGAAAHCEIRLHDRDAPPEQALIRAAGGEFKLESRCRTRPVRLNERQEPILEPISLPSNSVFLVGGVQILFLYDFCRDGQPVSDPLARMPRRRLLGGVAEQTGHSYRELSRLCRSRRHLGQRLGEKLVEEGLVTPLFWRAVCARLLSQPERRSWVSRVVSERLPQPGN